MAEWLQFHSELDNVVCYAPYRVHIHSWLSHWEGRPREPQPTRVTPTHARAVQGSWCGTCSTTTPNTTTSSGRRYVASSRHVRPNKPAVGHNLSLVGWHEPEGSSLVQVLRLHGQIVSVYVPLAHTVSTRSETVYVSLCVYMQLSECQCVCACDR